MVPIHLTPFISALPIQELNQHLATLYNMLGAGQEDCFHFTSGGRDAIEQIFFSHYIDVIRQTGRNHILTLPVTETPLKQVLKQCEILGCSAKTLPLNAQGQIAKQALIETIRPRSSLISIPWADGLTGVIQPLHDIVEVCQQNQIRLHVDGTFALGKLFFRFEDLEVDFLSFDGAYLRAPIGTGGFIVRSPIKMERKFDVLGSGLKSFTQSIENILQNFDHFSTETARLRDKFEKGMRNSYPEAHLFFQHVERLPTVAVIAFPGILSETLLYLLHKKGIFASRGGGYFPQLPEVLISYGIDPLLAHSALSFSLSEDTTEEQIDYAVEQISIIANKARLWSKEILP